MSHSLASYWLKLGIFVHLIMEEEVPVTTIRSRISPLSLYDVATLDFLLILNHLTHV